MALKINIPVKFNNPFKKGKGDTSQVRGEANKAGAPKTIPIIGRLPIGKQLQLLGVSLLVFLMIAVVSAYFDNRSAQYGTEYIEESSRLLMLSQRLAKDAQQSLAGNFNAFEGLTQSRQEVTEVMTMLDVGDAGLPPTRGKPREVLDELTPMVNKTIANVRLMEEGRTGLLTLSRAITVMGAMELELRGMTQQLIQETSNSTAATRFALLVERMAKDATFMLAEVTVEQVASLGADTQEANELLSKFPQTELVSELKDFFDGYRAASETIIGNSQNLLPAKQAGKAIFDSSDQLLEHAQKLTDAYTASLSRRPTSYAMVISGVMVVLLLALLAKVYLEDTRHRAQEAELVNSINQQAILRLMNELSDLANGDLTVKATVSEDITGAIADSVNYTTDELRKLVVGVSSASQQVAKATSEAGAVAKELMVAAQKQSDEIREAGGAVDLMTKSIQEVDASATKSAEAARRTLKVTEQGAQAVQNTITGMDGIREQIQETSKRIKRLGESSQEIGEIVDLISDITEQTNVLALNAAIQAASAGEAGRGFSVVAEEVQRLAERSGEATKQIGLLVKAIQSDTHDAVAAMEKSTQGVVEGARLSDAAGQALREIEETTHELADSVNSISVSTQMQTDMASEVATLMKEILQITKQTTDNTQRTTSSVAQLEKLASDLSGSVSGFKL